ncbi:hypothetical protein ACWEOE_22375 [Amycolatopsis sp. NPDC004368]
MRAALGADFRRLWWASTASEAGSALGYGAMPLVAVLILRTPAAQVSLLAAVPSLAGALLALPLGGYVEFRRKRPVMITADVVRFAVLATVPLTIALGVVSLAQLYVVGIAQTTALVAFTAASGAHLRALVPGRHRADAAGRFEAASWTVNSAGPPSHLAAVWGRSARWLFVAALGSTFGSVARPFRTGCRTIPV